MSKQFRISSLLNLFFTIVLVIVFIVSIGYRILVEIPLAEESIETVYNKELTILSKTFDEYTKNLEKSNYDYAVWDDTYNFIHSQDSDYIKSNFSVETFKNLNIEGVIITDSSDNIIYSDGFNSKELKPIDISALNTNNKFKYSDLLQRKNIKPISISELINFNNDIVIVTATPIFKTDTSGEYAGHLIFLRVFNQADLDSISAITQLELKLIPYSDQYRNLQAIKNIYVARSSSKNRQRLVDDYKGVPIKVIDITHQNEVDSTIITKAMVITLSLQFLIMVAFYLLVEKYVVKPIVVTNKDIKKMTDITSIQRLENNTIFAEINDMEKQFNQLVDMVEKQRMRLTELGMTDSLTQIANRLAFEQHFEKEWAHLQRHNITFAIVMCDIDFFKKYNDSLGHLAGDEALKTVATTLAKSARRINDIVARYGGEEFVILFSGIELKDLKMKLDQIIDSINNLNIAHPASEIADHVTISLGATLMRPTKDNNQKSNLIKAMSIADNALYTAKNNGRNRAEIAINE
ncbi:diguanylate cyclase domain-containing protein [Thalassotalea crassostreae]|uniref:sensor domain-containing diguanylate cyclase n=1 Tax=Thalassotalea crassostreae TaxID=1763536 RepID=UPI0008A246FA|nr:diguanylate cyclase [Thalassotalea crassostreae]